MKKVGMFLLVLVMVAGMVGCNGDDDDDNNVAAAAATANFNFNGHWIINNLNYTGKANGCETMTNISLGLTITQHGASATIVDDYGEHRGTCDPTGTKAITWIMSDSDGVVMGNMSGYGGGGDAPESMYGSGKMIGCTEKFTWSAYLASR